MLEYEVNVSSPAISFSKFVFARCQCGFALRGEDILGTPTENVCRISNRIPIAPPARQTQRMSDADWGFALEHDAITILGNRDVWGGRAPFGILRADRRQHFYVIGKSGAGKTTLLRNVILQDIEAGHGVGVIDPHV